MDYWKYPIIEEICRVVVHLLGEEEFVVDLCKTRQEMDEMSVGRLKKKISVAFGQPGDDVQLFFRGKELSDNTDWLGEIGIKHLSVVYMHQKFHVERPQKCQILARWFSGGKEYIIDFCNTKEEMAEMTVGHLWEKILEVTMYPEWNLRLVIGDTVSHKLLSDKTERLGDLGIKHLSLIFILIKQRAGRPPDQDSTDEGLCENEGDSRRSKKCLMLDV